MPIPTRPFAGRCERCGEEMRAHTMSVFNTDVICLQCKMDEKLAPGYEAAMLAESSAVRNGDRNFMGIGLSIHDRMFLADRLKRRPLNRQE